MNRLQRIADEAMRDSHMSDEKFQRLKRDLDSIPTDF
jgi:hypothetical protein